MISRLTALALALQPLACVAQFRSETRLVQISAVVRDRRGPVANLTKDDFILTDRGKIQPIGVFSLDKASGAPGTSQPLPPNTFSNRLDGVSSATVILLDSLNTLNYTFHWGDSFPTHFENLAAEYAKRQALKFVSVLDPKDHVALYALSKSLRVLCDFTGDSQQLKKTLAEYREGPGTDSDLAEPVASDLPTQPEFNAAVDQGDQQVAGLANGSRAGMTLGALAAIAARVGGIPGRKNLVWITASMPFSATAAARILTRANIAVYPVDARGLTASFNPRFRPAGLEGMQELADQTGGLAFFNTNDIAGAIRRAVEDSAVTYTLGFYPDSESLDGKFHELRLRVKRHGLEVRHTKGYFAFPETRSSEAQNQNSLQRAVRSPLEASAIPLLVRVERADHGKPHSLKMVGSVDLRYLQLVEAGNVRQGSVDIYVVQLDTRGAVLDRSHNRFDLRLTGEQYAAYLKSGVYFSEDLQTQPGAATLRVLAGDARNANFGSLTIPLSQVQ